MARTIEFELKEEWESEILAETFSAYLQGARVCNNRRDENGVWRQGPYRKVEGDNDRWQLDETNDYFLHISGNKVRIDCRYNGAGEKVIEAMVALFQARYQFKTTRESATA